MKKEKAHERLIIKRGKHLTVAEHRIEGAHPPHWHSFFEVEILLSGSGRCTINDVVYPLSEMNAFLLTNADLHRLEIDEPTVMLNISFDEKFLEEGDLLSLLFSKAPKAYCLPLEERDRLISAAKLLEHECAIEGSGRRQLLQYILNCFFRRSPAPMKEEQSDGLKKAIVYMKLHFREPISLALLAAEAGYHPAYFSELFKKYTGETYTEFLNHLRLGYARTLLANGFSVSEACFLSGFNSLSNFGAIFKKNCKVSPREYARSTRKD